MNTHRNLAVALAAAMATFIIMSASPALAAGPHAKVSRTEVSRFEPPMPVGPGRKGYCWGSIADPRREGAWRCMAGSEIYDPCFTAAGRNGVVVCGADPFESRKPFLMTLTKPLEAPAEPSSAPRLSPWLVELADGTRCGRMTGTLAMVDREPVAFGCWKPSRKTREFSWPAIGLFDDFSRGKVWTVTKVVYVPSKSSDKPFDLVERSRVEVRTVWW